MPNAKIVAPPNPRAAREKRAAALAAKPNRTPAETNELLQLLVSRIEELEQRHAEDD